MQLNAPNGQQVTFGAQTPNMVVSSVSFDLVNHTYVVVYGPASGGSLNSMKTVTGAIPAGIQTQLEAHAQTVIENQNGWTAGSSTIATP